MLHHSGAEVAFRYEKLKALLAYVVCHADTAQARAHLAEMLWPDNAPPAALSNLRRALFDLRKLFQSLGVDCPVNADRRGVRWMATPDIAIERVAHGLEEDPRSWLKDIQLDDCPIWQRWLQNQHDPICRQWLSDLDEQVIRSERRGDWSLAIRLAEHRVKTFPDHADGHQQLIQLLTQYGDHQQTQEVRRRYDLWRASWRDEKHNANPIVLGHTPTETERIEYKGKFRQKRVPVTMLVIHRTTSSELHDMAHRWIENCQSHASQHGGHARVLSNRLMIVSWDGMRALEHTPRRAWAVLQHHGRLIAQSGTESWQAAIAHGNTFVWPDPPFQDVCGDVLSEALTIALTTPAGHVGLNKAARLMLSRQLQQSDGRYQDDNQAWIAPLPQTDQTLGLEEPDIPNVGREAEMAMLQAWWGGQGAHHFHIEGDAGIGKTRLITQMRSWVLNGQAQVLLVQADPLFSHHPWRALKQSVQRIVSDPVEQTICRRLVRLRRICSRKPGISSAAWASLTRLLELPSPLDEKPIDIHQQRAELERGLFELLHHWCDNTRLLLILEDTHWLDQPTWQTAMHLTGLAAWPAHWKLLTSARTGESLGSPSVGLELAPLSRAAACELTRHFAHSAQVEISEQMMDDLILRAEGVPLYLEQVIQAHHGTGEVNDVSAPSLNELLLARIHRLGPHLAFAQVAACTGRVIDLPLLKHHPDWPEERIHLGLNALHRCGMVQREGDQWVFRHALIVNAALDSMRKETRQEVHLQLANLMRKWTPEQLQRAPEQLALHLHEAHSPDAPAAWLAAARHFNRRSEMAAARHHLQQGLNALPLLRDDASRHDMSFRLWVETGHTLVALEGYGSTSSRAAYAQALSLAQGISDEGDLFQLMWGMWLGSRTVDDKAPPMTFAHRLAHSARESTDPGVQLQVHYAFGNNHFWLAQYPEARRRLQQAVELSRQVHIPQMIALYGEASHVCAMAFLSWIDWLEGHAHRARAQADEAIVHGRRTGHAHTLCFALAFSATLHRYLDQASDAERQADELALLADEHRLVLWQATAAAVKGWSQARRGNADGLPAIRAALAGAQQAMPAVETTFLAFLADALVHLEHWDEAAQVIEDGLRTAQSIPDTYLLPELLRLSAITQSALGPQATQRYRSSLQKGLEVADSQGSLALRHKLEQTWHVLLH